MKTAKDHPRVGGEKMSLTATVATPLGSPPRGRGKDLCGLERGRAEGITPAWAGKSVAKKWNETGGEDHPRVGGEKLVSLENVTCAGGSPPRGRGKGYMRNAKVTAARITPAWAGKSAA